MQTHSYGAVDEPVHRGVSGRGHGVQSVMQIVVQHDLHRGLCDYHRLEQRHGMQIDVLDTMNDGFRQVAFIAGSFSNQRVQLLRHPEIFTHLRDSSDIEISWKEFTLLERRVRLVEDDILRHAHIEAIAGPHDNGWLNTEVFIRDLTS